jgi:sugar O-acyltransferase (sialic acid O-acetyltransferase NeuD family)
MGEQKRIVLFGAGGFARETAFLLEDINQSYGLYQIVGYVDADETRTGVLVSGYPILGSFRRLADLAIDCCALAVGDPALVERICLQEVMGSETRLEAPNLLHPAIVYRRGYVAMGDGNVICAGSVLTTDIEMGCFNLINRMVTIGHDCRIGSYNVINPLASISGGVVIGNKVLIGTGATILQNVKIGDSARVGAGAVVTQDVPPGVTVTGVPARHR